MSVKSSSSPELVNRVQAIEDRADLCYQNLPFLLKDPWNVGVWASLVAAGTRVEALPRFAYGGKSHLVLLLNLSRMVPLLVHWCSDHGARQTAPVSKFQWTRTRQTNTATALEVAAHYATFCALFPAWHHDLVTAELSDLDNVTFMSNDGPQARRISAYQKSFGPTAVRESVPAVQRTPEMEEYINSALDTIKPKGLQISFPKTERLQILLNKMYQDRLGSAFRRYEGITLGRYCLKGFRTVYAALLSVAAAHEHICYRWSLGRKFPFGSAVIHYARTHWVSLLSELSLTDAEIVSAIIDDLTLGATRLSDLMVHPFVSLDEDKRRLGLSPHFVLASNSEENILRTCSLVRPRFHNAASAEKEQEMREELSSERSPFNLRGPIWLRGDLPDIDLLVEDPQSSTVAICELKWGRKPYFVTERRSRDVELKRGADQLAMIQKFPRSDPSFLQKRGLVKDRLDEYRRVEYLLVARDHLMWIPPSDARAIVGFNPFQAMLKRPDLAVGLTKLLSYEWLPVEGKDFTVATESSTVNGVTIRSETFYPA